MQRLSGRADDLSGCACHFYCDAACQAAMWPSHRSECKDARVVASVFDALVDRLDPLLDIIVGRRPFSHHRTLVMHFVPAATPLSAQPFHKLRFCCSATIPEDWHVCVAGTNLRDEEGTLRREIERPIAEGQMRVIVTAGSPVPMHPAPEGSLRLRWRILFYEIEPGFEINPKSLTDWPRSLGTWGFEASGGVSWC